MSDWQYWDLEMKSQSKRKVALVNAAIEKFGAIVHDRYEEKYFTGKQQWRNPLTLRISLPKGQKYAFLLAAKVSCWLHEPDKIGITEEVFEKPNVKLRGSHDELRRKLVRTCRLHPIQHACIKDAQFAKVIEGAENVSRVLNGELNLIIDNQYEYV
jgi:hypothetical protein